MKTISTVFFIFCIIAIFFVFPVIADTNHYSESVAGDGNNSNNSLILAERDVLSFSLHPQINETANLTLILYHEAWLFNTYNQSKTVTILSPIPKERYKPSTGYPLFGKKYLIQQSLIPDYFHPATTRVLGNASIMEGDDSVNFVWDNITIAPQEAVIIAYANEYQDGSEINHHDGFELPGIKLTRSFDNHTSDFVLNYSMENTGNLGLHYPKFILFFPESVGGTRIFKPSEITIKSNCRMDIFENTSYNDGTGSFSTGHMMLSHCPEDLGSAQSDNFLIEIKGTGDHSGTLIPSIIMGYRADEDPFNTTSEMKKIWPSDDFTSDEKLNVTRFYYYEASLFIPETKFCTVIPVNENSTFFPFDHLFIFLSA